MKYHAKIKAVGLYFGVVFVFTLAVVSLTTKQFVVFSIGTMILYGAVYIWNYTTPKESTHD